MLIDDIERYIASQQAAGHTMKTVMGFLRSYSQFASEQGDTHVRAATALQWAAKGSSPLVRYRRMRAVVRFARFQKAEDNRHEIPPLEGCQSHAFRPVPYIYSNEEIARLLKGADKLRLSYRNPLRRETFRMLFGLIACTGLRKSEALDLRLTDLSSDGVLTIRCTKFRKSRLVPLHESVLLALQRYLTLRLNKAGQDDHVFLSASGGRIEASVVKNTFLRILKLAEIAPNQAKRPRIHDLRHTFATRALERCPNERSVVTHHMVAVSTYLGHAGIAATQWYLQATPNLMTDIAAATESSMWGGLP